MNTSTVNTLNTVGNTLNYALVNLSQKFGPEMAKALMKAYTRSYINKLRIADDELPEDQKADLRALYQAEQI